MDIDLSRPNLEADNAVCIFINNFKTNTQNIILFQLEQISLLRQKLSELQANITCGLQPTTSDNDLNKLITHNIKLKHRLAILNRVSSI